MGPGGTEEILLVHRRKHYLLYISCYIRGVLAA
uniref:Uncharacterized protein n=1 Tax=Physcomitrium patens TaxID=3218 RepID=A0A2K1IMB8_PHYPA|nr:hypothetical protein PHYPA_026732 [Physcomitrium patens]